MPAQEFKRQHREQRRVIVMIVASAIAALLLASLVAWWWASSGSAQQSAQPASATPSAVNVDDLMGRFEELSRSQDRLVQEIIAITALIGTGFLVLLGVNAIQANRNFERESAFIREYAEIQIAKAVTEAREQLGKLVEEEAEEVKASVKRAATAGYKRLDERGKEASDEIDQRADEAKKLMQDYLYSFSTFLTWSVRKEAQALKDLKTTGEAKEVRLHAISLYELSVVLFDLVRFANDPRLSQFQETALANLNVALVAMMTGLTVPEEFDYWYSDSGRHYSKVNQILDFYDGFDKYMPACREIRRLMPSSAQKLDDQALQRLVARTAASSG